MHVKFKFGLTGHALWLKNGCDFHFLWVYGLNFSDNESNLNTQIKFNFIYYASDSSSVMKLFTLDMGY